jgi:hypothetical protein
MNKSKTRTKPEVSSNVVKTFTQTFGVCACTLTKLKNLQGILKNKNIPFFTMPHIKPQGEGSLV